MLDSTERRSSCEQVAGRTAGANVLFDGVYTFVVYSVLISPLTRTNTTFHMTATCCTCASGYRCSHVGLHLPVSVQIGAIVSKTIGWCFYTKTWLNYSRVGVGCNSTYEGAVSHVSLPVHTCVFVFIYCS